MLRFVICAVLFASNVAFAQNQPPHVSGENTDSFEFQAGPGKGVFEIVLSTRSTTTTLLCPLPRRSVNELLKGRPGIAKIYKESCEPISNGRAAIRYEVPREHWNRVHPIGVAAVPESLIVQIYPHLFFIIVEKNGKVREATQAEVDMATQPGKAI